MISFWHRQMLTIRCQKRKLSTSIQFHQLKFLRKAFYTFRACCLQSRLVTLSHQLANRWYDSVALTKGFFGWRIVTHKSSMIRRALETFSSSGICRTDSMEASENDDVDITFVAEPYHSFQARLNLRHKTRILMIREYDEAKSKRNKFMELHSSLIDQTLLRDPYVRDDMNILDSDDENDGNANEMIPPIRSRYYEFDFYLHRRKRQKKVAGATRNESHPLDAFIEKWKEKFHCQSQANEDSDTPSIEHLSLQTSHEFDSSIIAENRVNANELGEEPYGLFEGKPAFINAGSIIRENVKKLAELRMNYNVMCSKFTATFDRQTPLYELASQAHVLRLLRRTVHIWKGLLYRKRMEDETHYLYYLKLCGGAFYSLLEQTLMNKRRAEYIMEKRAKRSKIKWFERWKKELVRKYERDNLNAKSFRRFLLMRMSFSRWRRYVQSSKLQNVHHLQADEFRRSQSLKYHFQHWMKALFMCRYFHSLEKIADDQRRFSLCLIFLRKWRRSHSTRELLRRVFHFAIYNWSIAGSRFKHRSSFQTKKTVFLRWRNLTKQCKQDRFLIMKDTIATFANRKRLLDKCFMIWKKKAEPLFRIRQCKYF